MADRTISPVTFNVQILKYLPMYKANFIL